MNTKLLYLIMALAFTSSAFSQDDEPKAIDPKEMMDKLDRSDISEDDDNTSVEGMVPDFEIPKIEFNNDVKVEEAKESKGSKDTKASKSEESRSTQSKTQKKNRVLISNRAITKLSQLKNKDKIVAKDGKILIYRLSKNNIIQYKFKGDFPLDSAGLKKENDNSYYVVDKQLLNGGDSASSKLAQSAANSDEKIEITDELMAARKAIEEKFNSGKEIKRSITLKGLQINDTVYVFEKVQLVTRRSTNIAGLRKYWLTEKLDPTNSSVKELSKNKYQIYKRYQQ